jgi:hypothetical protein
MKFPIKFRPVSDEEMEAFRNRKLAERGIYLNPDGSMKARQRSALGEIVGNFTLLLLVVAFSAFCIVGVVGLLWFGIKQFI